MKRSKERSRQEKQRDKQAKRQARKIARDQRPAPDSDVDPDIAGIVPGPQPTESE